MGFKDYYKILGVDKNGAVRIGVDAPSSVKILRRELRALRGAG